MGEDTKGAFYGGGSRLEMGMSSPMVAWKRATECRSVNSIY